MKVKEMKWIELGNIGGKRKGRHRKKEERKVDRKEKREKDDCLIEKERDKRREKGERH